ncbi:hypothetical protein [Chondromyces crocatus]|uniref:Uncharacterized protein n=1 Tax=Chondromyces crocatus TaxID=52 RepID=A0A0K1EFI7_CHOCO|nr:hypothetical protein [Chondromyces crocatus]AKT39604.1 uncharacterized protein CMC5_037530 [Chondromyces crocatus]
MAADDPIDINNVTLTIPAQVQGQFLTNLVYIDDQPQATDTIEVRLATLDDKNTVQLQTSAATQGQKASSTNYHFYLLFSSGSLAAPEGITAGDTASWSLYVDPQSKESANGGICVYVLYTGQSPIVVDSAAHVQVVALQNFGATSTNGARPDVVQFSWNDQGWVDDASDPSNYVRVVSHPDSAADPGNAPIIQTMNYLPSETLNVNIVTSGTGQGAQTPTLYVSFETPNIVINDGTTQNSLILRIVNLGLADIPLDPKTTQFVVYLDGSQSTGDRWALATQAQLEAIKASVTSGFTAGNARADGTGASWTITTTNTVLKARGVLEITLSNLVTGHATGGTPLQLRYLSIPGFPDGLIPVQIQKLPMHYTGDLLDKVGIGTKSSQTALDVRGHTLVNEGYVGIGTTTPQASLDVHGNAIVTGGNVGIGKVTPQAPLDVSGNALISMKLGIGTTSPAASLDVHGGALFNGGNVGIGTTSPQAPLDLRGNALVNGGNVGIGTTNPAYPLTVQTSDGQYGIAHKAGAIELATWVGENMGWIGTKSNHNLAFFAGGGAAQMTLTPDGKVGIGTTTPAATLDVNGAFRLAPGQPATGLFPFQISKVQRTNTFQAGSSNNWSSNVDVTFSQPVATALVVTTEVHANYNGGADHDVQNSSYNVSWTISGNTVTVQYHANFFDKTGHSMENVYFSFCVLAVLEGAAASITPQ